MVLQMDGLVYYYTVSRMMFMLIPNQLQSCRRMELESSFPTCADMVQQVSYHAMLLGPASKLPLVQIF